jgi:hypothetical protein
MDGGKVVCSVKEEIFVDISIIGKRKFHSSIYLIVLDRVTSMLFSFSYCLLMRFFFFPEVQIFF